MYRLGITTKTGQEYSMPVETSHLHSVKNIIVKAVTGSLSYLMMENGNTIYYIPKSTLIHSIFIIEEIPTN